MSFVDTVKERVGHLRINADLNDEDYGHQKLVDLAGLYAPIRGQGIGTEFMQILCDQADKDQIGLEVYAGIAADNCDPERLIGFYSRFGFVLQNPHTWSESGIDRPYLIRLPR